jgi:hypothetical protein
VTPNTALLYVCHAEAIVCVGVGTAGVAVKVGGTVVCVALAVGGTVVSVAATVGLDVAVGCVVAVGVSAAVQATIVVRNVSAASSAVVFTSHTPSPVLIDLPSAGRWRIELLLPAQRIRGAHPYPLTLFLAHNPWTVKWVTSTGEPSENPPGVVVQ